MQLGSRGEATFKAAKSLTTWEQLQQTDGIAKDSTRMFVVFLGNTLERKQGVIPPEDAPMVCFMEDAATQMLECDKKAPNWS